MSDHNESESEYLSITMEALNANIDLVHAMPDLSPKPARFLFPDYILWKVGGLSFRRPLAETLPDFLRYHLKGTFGQDWANAQFKLPASEQHVVLRWLLSFSELIKESAGPSHKDGHWFKITPSGDAMEFMSLADDVYRLRLTNALLPKMIKRLKNHAEFQGARYECAIAASFIRSGFEIVWEIGPATKCEFTATHKLSGESIAIEVKSRRRKGTLNEPGKAQGLPELRVDVDGLYKKAVSQCPTDRPCGIFIDVNLPPESAKESEQFAWLDEIKAMMDKYPESSANSPTRETCLIFTSFGWHYTGKEKAKGMRHIALFPKYVIHHPANMLTYMAILRAVETYGEIPTTE